MSVKLFLSSNAILEKVFHGATPGYNPLEVDTFLDQVIKDYKIVESNYLLKKKEVDDLNAKIERLENENSALKLENEKFNQRYGNLKPTENVSQDNMKLLKRIDALEKFLFKEGYDVTKIK